jgi:4-amino-4-deoxy-L-arabinose transferase-like glycosyltransferase
MTPQPDARRLALEAWRCGVILLIGAAWVALLYQVPAHHQVDIGGYDAAYVQGFSDPQREEAYPATSQKRFSYLEGSDGNARWLRSSSFLIFPQAGLPATVTLRLRGWQPANTPPPVVAVFLNGRTPLGTIETGGEWEEHTFTIAGGILKASDVVVELRASSVPPPEADQSQVAGVLLDRAAYRVAGGNGRFITPYPTQIVYGGVVLALLWLATGRGRVRAFFARFWWGALLLGVLFLFVCRLQPPLYPYPLRWLLPTLVAVLAVVVALRYAPALLALPPAVADILALVCVVVWLAALLLISQEHVTLSVPGVEKDFRVYATRAPEPARVFQADGFYNLGYPFVLWLARPFTFHNAFLAGRLVAALSGALLLLAGYLLARHLLVAANARETHSASCQHNYHGAAALLALLCLACNPLVARYALYLGSDMPFAALTTLSLALLLARWRGQRWAFVGVVLAGGAAGGAFLMRHPGLVLLPWGILACQLLATQRTAPPPPDGVALWLLAARRALPFVAGFALVALPQVVVNIADTGQPLYSQQAKNIWLAVYGNIDWSRWDEVPNSIALREVVLRNPARFAANWWSNVVRFIGAGSEDSSEFGRAIQIRLLHWPANWLAILGLAGWLALLVRARCTPAKQPCSRQSRAQQVILLFLAFYVLAVCVGFVLLRFFLPLVPIYAAAAAWAVQAAIDAAAPRESAPGTARARWLVAAALLLIVLMSGGVRLGARYVLDHQPADEVAMARMIEQAVPPGEQIYARVSPGAPLVKYSAAAHRIAAWSEGADEEGAVYLLWEAGQSDLPTGAVQVGKAGRYALYRLTP